MPKIPIYNAQGNKKVQAPAPIQNPSEAGAPYRALQGLGESVSNVGSVLTQIDQKFKRVENENQYSESMLGVKQFFNEDKEFADNNNDLTDWQTKHESSIANKRSELSGKIKDNATRTKFLQDFDLLSIDHRVAIKNGYRKKTNAQGRILVDQNLDVLQESYVNAETKEQRAKILQDVKNRVNQAVSVGLYTREKAQELIDKKEKEFTESSFNTVLMDDPELALDMVKTDEYEFTPKEKVANIEKAEKYIAKHEAKLKKAKKQVQADTYNELSKRFFEEDSDLTETEVKQLWDDDKINAEKAEHLINNLRKTPKTKLDITVWSKLKSDSTDKNIDDEDFLDSLNDATANGDITRAEAQKLHEAKQNKTVTADTQIVKSAVNDLKLWVKAEGLDIDETAEATILQDFHTLIETEKAKGERIIEIREQIKRDWNKTTYPETSHLEQTPNNIYQDGDVEPLIASKSVITPDYVYNPEDGSVVKYDGKEKPFYSIYVPDKGIIIGSSLKLDEEQLKDVVEQQFYPELYGKNAFMRWLGSFRKDVGLPETETEAEQEGDVLRTEQEELNLGDDEYPNELSTKKGEYTQIDPAVIDAVFNRPTSQSINEYYDQPHMYEPVTTLGQKLSDTGESLAYSLDKFVLGGSRSVVEQPIKAIGGLLQEYGELTADMPVNMYPPTIFSNKIATFGKRISKNITELANSVLPDSVSKETDTVVEEFAGKMGSGFGSLASFVGIGLLTGNSAIIPAIVEGVMAKGTKYPEAREKGKTVNEASLISSTLGGVTSAFGAIGFNFLFKNYGGRLANVGIRSFTEGTQELFQTGGEQAIDIATGLRNYKGLPELVKEQVESFAIGALVSAPTSVMIDYAEDQGLIKQLQEVGISKQGAKKIVKQMQKTIQKEAETVAEKEIEKATDSMDKAEAQEEQLITDLQKPKDEGGRGLTQEEAEAYAKENLVDGTDKLAVPNEVIEEVKEPEPESEIEQQIKGERIKVLTKEKKARKKKGLSTEKIDARIKEIMPEVKTEIPVLTEEEYLNINDASRLGMGEPALHKNIKEGRAKRDALKRISERDHALIEKRAVLRKEYKEKVESGEIRTPTKIEQLLKTAQGMDEREDVQASRRLLEKRGIDWKTGEAKTEPVKPAEKEPWQMTRDELRKQLWNKHLEEYPNDKTGDNKQIVQDRIFRRADIKHRGEITTAFINGKPIPQEVLKDYTDLQKEAKTGEPAKKVSKAKSENIAVDEVTPKDESRLEAVKYSNQKGFTPLQKDVFVAKLLEAREQVLKENEETKGTVFQKVPYISAIETKILDRAGLFIKRKGETSPTHQEITQANANSFMKNVAKFEEMGLVERLTIKPKLPKDWKLTDIGRAAVALKYKSLFVSGKENSFFIKLPDDGTFQVKNDLDAIDNMLKRLKVKSADTTPETKPKKDRSKEGGFVDFSRPTPEETGIQGKPKKWTPRTNGKINTKSGKTSQAESFDKYLEIYEEKQSAEEIMESISAFYGSLDWDKTQTKVAEDRRKKELPDTYNRDVVSMYIELRNQPEIIDKHYDKLPDRVKAIVDGVSTMGETEIKYAKEMMERYQELGEMGKKLGILDAMHEDYINHVWLKNKSNIKKAKTAGVQSIGGKFVHGKKRIFDSFLEGIAKGYEPLTLDSAELLAVYEDRFFKAVHSKVFLEQLKSMTLPNGETAVEFASLKNDNYVVVNHPSLTKYKYIGQKIDNKTGEVVPNIVKKELVVHKDIAKAVENVLKGSTLRNAQGIKQLLQFGALGKTTLLTFSGFHFTALGKTAVFYGVNPLWFGGNNYVTGIDLIANEDPIVKHGVQVGRLGLGGSSNVETATIIANQGIEWLSNLDQGFVSDHLLNAKKWFDKGLWDHYFTGLKALSYRMEYLKNVDRYKGLNRDEIAKITARDINDNFGGLAWEKLSVSPSTLDGLRLALLAPDWTFSNWRLFGNAVKINDALRYLKGNRVPIFNDDGEITGFQKLHEWRNTTKGTSRFMAKSYATLGLVTMMANAIMNGNPFPHEEDDMWSKFWMIKLPYTDEHGRAKYLDLFGHLAEPIKALTDPVRWASGKVSIPARMVTDQIKGTNWKGDWLGNIDDLLQGKTTRSKYKDQPESGVLGWKALPVRVIHGFDVMTPISADTASNIVKGKKTVLEGVAELGGFAVRSGRSMGFVEDEKQRRKLTKQSYITDKGFSKKMIERLKKMTKRRK